MLLLNSNGDATVATAIRAAIVLVTLIILGYVLIKRGHKKAVIISSAIGLVLGIITFAFVCNIISSNISLGMKILAASSKAVLTAGTPLTFYIISKLLRKLRRKKK